MSIRLDETTLGDQRYGRQELITWWDQDRLRRAQVLVVGAGALGNEIIKCLMLLGVGRVHVVDLDDIELSNLSRCVFFRPEDDGAPKAATVVQRASELNDEVELSGGTGDIRVAIGLGAWRDFDVVLAGLDNREARVHVSRACIKTATPWVDGAIEGLVGVARSFVPGSACYECTMNEIDRRLMAVRRACTLLGPDEIAQGRTPTTATTASVIAAIQVQEAVKLLHRDVLPYDFGGHGFVFNGLTHDSYVVEYSRLDGCFGHDEYDFEDAGVLDRSLTVGQALALGTADLRASSTDGTVLDLEIELFSGVDCPECGFQSAEPVPALLTPADAADCPTCGHAGVPRVSSSLSEDLTPELIAHRLGDLGLPDRDVITARAGDRRRHYLLEGLQ